MIAYDAFVIFSIPVLDFPTCVVGEQGELTADALVSYSLTLSSQRKKYIEDICFFEVNT